MLMFNKYMSLIYKNLTLNYKDRKYNANTISPNCVYKV